MKSQAQLEFPQFKGEALTQLPDDLFIPPEALEIYLEDFSGPMDVLLYLIQKKDIDILDLDVSEITDQYVKYIELMDARELSLDLNSVQVVKKPVSSFNIEKIKNRNLPSRLSDQEKKLHDSFIETLGEHSIWNKIKTGLS